MAWNQGIILRNFFDNIWLFQKIQHVLDVSFFIILFVFLYSFVLWLSFLKHFNQNKKKFLNSNIFLLWYLHVCLKFIYVRLYQKIFQVIQNLCHVCFIFSILFQNFRVNVELLFQFFEFAWFNLENGHIFIFFGK